MKILAAMLGLMCAHLAYAHNTHTGWEQGMPREKELDKREWHHRHPGGDFFEYEIRDFHNEHHGGNSAHARFGGWHYICLSDDNGRSHFHDPPDNKRHPAIKWDEIKKKNHGHGTWDGNCPPKDPPDIVTHTHTLTRIPKGGPGRVSYIEDENDPNVGEGPKHLHNGMGIFHARMDVDSNGVTKPHSHDFSRWRTPQPTRHTSPPTPRLDDDGIDDTLSRHDGIGIDNCVPIADAYKEYAVDLSSGYARLAIPHGAIGINGCGIEFEHISDFVDVFPDHIMYVYGVNLDRFSYGADVPDILLESYPNEDKELYDGFGFLGRLKQDLMFTWSVEPKEVSVDLTIREGYTAYGVPVQSEDLVTLGDFFDLFGSISTITGRDDDGNTFWVWRNTEVNHDILVEGWRSYLIRSRREETVTLTGQTWRDPTAAAPHIRHYHKMAVTWGQVKRGLIRERGVSTGN